MSTRAWVATRKGLFEMQRDDERSHAWRIARVNFLGEPVTVLLPPAADDPQGRMLAALNLGHFGVHLHRSDDAGASWAEVAAPAYPPQPPEDKGFAWKLVLVWSLERRGDTLWAGTLPGGLFRSADFGSSWQLVDALWQRPERAQWFGGGYPEPGIHSVCPHPQRPQELLVGLSCGGAWVSTDDGANWRVQADGMRADFMPPEQAGDPNIQDPHRIVRCAAAPEVLWCQHHCGIWRSTDNAASWHELKAPLSSFGFAVAVHPQDPDTAWFVPAIKDEKRVPVHGALVVNRTRDGGKSFETLRAGLPQREAYDLIYRHGLDVSADGQSLLMGSTTGGLWASSDGGDNWQTVSLNLPPIAAVRFG
ncbi:MAG: sialidase [Leptothrix sp. (in: Bacteria)]|nr:sialidase [Leptothrix sp. (in: b-proteobacteria)]